MQELIRVFQARQILQEAILSFFRQRNYLHLDTPIAVTSPGTEVHLQYFASEWLDFRGHRHPLYLRSSPELHLKQALSMGLARVFHLGKCFRNGGELSPWHHPEFTMLEWYETGISLPAFMQQTEELLRFGAAALEAQGFATLPLPTHIPRISVSEAFSRWAGIELIDHDPDLARKGRAKGFGSVREDDDFETAYFKILLDGIEPELERLDAAILYDYPASQCALARIVDGKAQRFELYLHGVELCNAFDELLDPVSNQERIAQSNQQRLQLGHGAVTEDIDFIAALERGFPACCGNAMGFDRLLGLLLQEPNLDRVVPFRWNLPYRQLQNP